jgi:adenosylmethionine-8-amino-7-oxononanoate aminotransferase
MSFHYWRNVGKTQKTQFVSLQNSYHGETVGALSVTDVAIFKDTYAPLLRQSVQMLTPDWRLAEDGETPEAYAKRAADALTLYFAEHHQTLAAFIIEPLVQCATGMAMHHPSYLQRVRALCDQYEIHLIADEIAVGFGRTGTMFACEQGDIRPDFICLSKGITGGYLPLSVVLTTDQVYAAFYDDETARGFLHSHSYTGNPLACRAALATLDIFQNEDVLNVNRLNAAAMLTTFATLDHAQIKHKRNTGMIWAFDVETTRPDFAKVFTQHALALGLIIRPIGNTVYFMPPYVITQDEFALLVTGSMQILNEMSL